MCGIARIRHSKAVNFEELEKVEFDSLPEVLAEGGARSIRTPTETSWLISRSLLGFADVLARRLELKTR